MNCAFFKRFIFRYSTERPRIRESKNKTINTKNNILAIPAAPAAIPPKPSTPAMMAMIKKIIVQRNICVCLNEKSVNNYLF